MATEHISLKKYLLAILFIGHGKSLIYQVLVLLTERAGNFASC